MAYFEKRYYECSICGEKERGGVMDKQDKRKAWYFTKTFLALFISVTAITLIGLSAFYFLNNGHPMRGLLLFAADVSLLGAAFITGATSFDDD